MRPGDAQPTLAAAEALIALGVEAAITTVRNWAKNAVTETSRDLLTAVATDLESAKEGIIATGELARRGTTAEEVLARAKGATLGESLDRFLLLRTVADPEARLGAADLHRIFGEWLRLRGRPEWSAKALSRAMTERGFKKAMGGRGAAWLGLRLTLQGAAQDGAR